MFAETHFNTVSGPIMSEVKNELHGVFSSSFNMGKVVGEGAYGRAYLCHVFGKDYVLKTQSCMTKSFSEIGEQIKRWSGEIEKMLYLQDYNLSPLIYYYGFYYDQSISTIYNVIVMENLQVSEKLLESKSIDVVDLTMKTVEASNRLISHRVSHRDYKWDNVGCRFEDGRLSVIPFDFGISQYIQRPSVYETEDASYIDRIRLISTVMCLNVDIPTKQIMYNLIRTPDMPLYNIVTKSDIHNIAKKSSDAYLKFYWDTISPI
jgi:serine/threonine protein kinase